MMFVQAGDWSVWTLLAFTILGQPEVQALQEQGPKGAEIHLADTCIYRKKGEKQDVTLEGVLLQQGADECR